MKRKNADGKKQNAYVWGYLTSLSEDYVSVSFPSFLAFEFIKEDFGYKQLSIAVAVGWFTKSLIVGD